MPEEETGHAPKPGKPVRKKWLLGAAAAVVVVSGGGYAVTDRPRSDKGGAMDQSDRLPPDTAPVTRGDLSSGTQVDGTLGYAKERKLNAAGPGTVTWVAGEGTSVGRDEKLYEVNGSPVRLMYGSMPMYRALKAGDKGEDVKQLKRNLQALGHGTGLDPEDGTFTDGTVTAVKRWQKSHKLKETGRLAKEDIAFAPGPQRVKSADSAVGDEPGPGKPVLTLTGTDRIVRMKLDPSKAGAAKVGDRVTVNLPDGSTAAGRIDAIGTAKDDKGGGSGGSGGGGGGGGGDKPKVEVDVVFDSPGSVKAPDQSPVTVGLTGETSKGVLSVPVNSLLALSGGGFGVQVVENGKVRDVRVELGMFGQGRVEVKDGALKEGMKVGVPKT